MSMPARPTRRAALLLLAPLALAAACAPDRGRTGGVPRAEFLLAAGDSTYWIATGPDGVHMRGAPLLLAGWGDRLYEVYATDDDRSFYDAVFTSQRVYRRDLLRGDSVAVVDDPRVPALAERYAVANPGERPLAPDEDAAEDPGTVATSEVALVDVHGPYLTLEQRADVETTGDAHEHRLQRAVIDLRTGRRASLAELFGDSAAVALAAEGRRRLTAAVDSVRALAVHEERDAADRARRALRTLRFDPASFGLGAAGAAPAVTFFAVGVDAEGQAVALALAPLPAPVPAWWARDVAPTLPAWRADSTEARWRVAMGAEVVARPADGVVRLSLRAGGRRGSVVSLGSVPAPVHALLPLARAARADAARRALRRAFDESAFYGDATTSVSWRPNAPQARRPQPARRVRVAHHR
jgi:hypothetical protein